MYTFRLNTMLSLQWKRNQKQIVMVEQRLQSTLKSPHHTIGTSCWMLDSTIQKINLSPLDECYQNLLSYPLGRLYTLWTILGPGLNCSQNNYTCPVQMIDMGVITQSSPETVILSFSWLLGSFENHSKGTASNLWKIASWSWNMQLTNILVWNLPEVIT